MKRHKPMKRTGFVAKPKPVSGLLRKSNLGESAMRLPSTPKLTQRKPIKVRRQKLSKIRASARDQDCTLRFPVCNGRNETTVLCHSNLLEDGKGMGLKAPDECGAFGCSACHDVLDGRAPRPVGFTYDQMISRFRQAVAATHVVLRHLGLLKAE
ncbi:nuclease domain-containing protein [Collimonas sp. NPDC087041]|uniref:nuclease domain-containing protein n=1 Tax=Collimonas sp. NPDC087041 TaxID=3363960 RepID=UPI0037FABD42